jgi:hypothetical protein
MQTDTKLNMIVLALVVLAATMSGAVGWLLGGLAAEEKCAIERIQHPNHYEKD